MAPPTPGDTAGDGLQDLAQRAQALAAQVQRLERRAEREREARKQAERLLLDKSAELYEALQGAQGSERAARESEHNLQLALWASGEGIWSWNAETDEVAVRNLVLAGRPVEEPPRNMQFLRPLIHRADLVGFNISWQMVTSGSREDIDAGCRIRWDGQWRWVRLRGRRVEVQADGRARRIVGTIKDITDQRQAEQSLRLMANAFANTHDAMAVLDDDWRIVEGNAALARLLALEHGQLAGLALTDLVDLPLDQIQGERLWRDERVLRCGNQSVDVDLVVATVDPLDGQGAYRVVALQDSRERKRAQEELRRQATSDALTGLPNRSAILSRLEAVLAQNQAAGLIFIDLDGFKLVNDSAGHEVGDGLLREVARRLREAIEPPSFVGRWGGDEFVVVAPQLAGEEEIAQLAAAILARCRQSMPAKDRVVAVGASLGAALAPRDGRDAATLLRHADAAMYQAKESGRNRLEFFKPELEHSMRRRAELLGQLRMDAESDSFQFAVQSVHDRQGRLAGGELLMRWSTALHGAVSPGEFIPLAEQAGLMPRIGHFALVTAVRMAARLKTCERSPGQPVRLAVNLSATQLGDGLLCEQLLALCEAHGVHPTSLNLELTESAYVHDMETTAPQLQALHRAGFCLSLDDFGTGYSALSQLRALPFDKVKIDRSFVMDITRNERAARLLQAMVQMCKGLGMATVAEGVETEAQHRLLHELGVDLFQGWHWGRPVPMDAWVDQVVRAHAAPR